MVMWRVLFVLGVRFFHALPSFLYSSMSLQPVRVTQPRQHEPPVSFA